LRVPQNAAYTSQPQVQEPRDECTDQRPLHTKERDEQNSALVTAKSLPPNA